ncbi:rRNA maturation RNase YbeY [Opitutales bacterium]|nr:rRNA maturation RNase YbeY [Opitutales bacterium]
MNPLQLEISNQYKRLADPETNTVALFRALEASGDFPISTGELSIVFASDSAIGKIHDDFMGDPNPTDVITFPANLAMGSAGEIIVSVDHARCRAKELGEPFSRELSLYLVHGWLHLAGYDDRNDTDRAAMRIAEQQALAIIDKAAAGSAFQLINRIPSD